nr:hypothetical protein [Tanacetum cinerariifolium]
MGQMAKALQERPLEDEQESETITKVVEIPSSQSTPLVSSPDAPPLSTPKPNPHQPLIIYLYRIQKDKSLALENPARRAD